MSHRTFGVVSLAAAVVIALAGATGCFTVNAALPGTLRNDVKSSDTESVGQLSVEKTNYFFLYGLIGEPSPDFFAAEIKQQVQAKGADGVAGLTYESQFGCVDLIIGAVTFGCVDPRTYKVTGNIVRIKAGRLPGKPAKTVDAAPLLPAATTIEPQRLATAKQSY